MDWFDAGQKELQNALKTKYNTNVAKNVIFFLGEILNLKTALLKVLFEMMIKRSLNAITTLIN